MKGPYRIRTPDQPEPELWEIENVDGELLTTTPSKESAEKLVEFMNDRPAPVPAKEILVPLQFTGTATVYVPATLKDSDARRLGERIALARILAATENPDAPEDEAFEEYVETCSRKVARSAESDWDASILAAVNGTWSIPRRSAKSKA